jgi:hypothetical protein
MAVGDDRDERHDCPYGEQSGMLGILQPVTDEDNAEVAVGSSSVARG